MAAIKEQIDIPHIKTITENFQYKLSNLELLKTKNKEYKESGFFVYVLIDEQDNVLYVGKTKELFTRLNTHIKEEKIDEWNKNIKRICFYNFESETDQSIIEIYLINELQGTYNISNKKDFPKHTLELQPFESLTYEKFLEFKLFSKVSTAYTTIEDSSEQILYEYFNSQQELLNSQLELFKSQQELFKSHFDITRDNFEKIVDSIAVRDNIIIDLHKQIIELEIKVDKLEKVENKNFINILCKLFKRK